jgi:hypothetical protein
MRKKGEVIRDKKGVAPDLDRSQTEMKDEERKRKASKHKREGIEHSAST